MACKDCKHCDKKGLLILPLRYSAVVAKQVTDVAATSAARAKDPCAPAVFTANPALKAFGHLPETLGAGVSDINIGPHATYGVRALRKSSYLYVLIERAGIKGWDAYMVLDNMQLYKFEAGSPPPFTPSAYCNRDQTSVDAYMVGIDKAEDVHNAWFLFSPSPLTEAKLSEYKANPQGMVGAGKMQHLSPSQWVTKANQKQPHTLTAEGLTISVEHYLAAMQNAAITSPLGSIAREQLFPVNGAAYGGGYAHSADGARTDIFARLQNTLKKREGAAIVLHDHIGIAQELNNFRNDAYELVDQFMEQRDAQGYTNQHKFSVQQSVEGIKTAIEQRMVAVADANIAKAQKRMDLHDENQRNMIKALRLRGDEAGAKVLEKDLLHLKVEREKNLSAMRKKAQETWVREYEPLLNQGAMKSIADAVVAIGNQAKAMAVEREAAHLAWLRSERLINAFDVFDPKHEKSGFAFTSHAHACYFGMDGTKNSEAKLDEWLKADTVERSNLFLRSYYYNQETAKIFVQEALANANGNAEMVLTSHSDWESLSKGAKKLIDFFKKADSAWDEWARVGPDGKQGNAWQVHAFDTYAEGRVLSSLSTVTRSVFRAGLKSQNNVFIVAEKKVVAKLSVLLYAKLGKTADKLFLEQLMYRIDPEFPFEVTEKSWALKGTKGGKKERKPTAGNQAPLLDKPYPHSYHEADLETREKMAQRHRETINKTLQDAFENADNSNYHQLRIGGVIAGLEAINVAAQMFGLSQKKEITFDDILKLGAGVCGLIAAGLEIAYTAAKVAREQVDWLVEKGAVHASTKGIVRGAGEITRGGFKLYGAMFGTVAGVVGVYFDYQAYKKSKQNDQYILATIQFARTISGALSVLGAAVAAFSYSGQYLTRHAIRHFGNKTLARGLLATGRVASRLAARVAILTWVVRLNAIGLTLTALEIGYCVFFGDKAMKKWCEKTVFRIGNESPYGSMNKELEALEEAFEDGSY